MKSILFFKRTDSVYGWSVYTFLPIKLIKNEASQIQIIVLLEAILFGIIILIMTRVLGTIITKPILRLTHLLSNDDVTFKPIDFQPKYRDEIGILISSFQRKSRQISRYLEELKIAEEQRTNAEFEAYTAQTKPTFFA